MCLFWEKEDFVIRIITKPSTAKCDLEKYTLFLLAEPKYSGCNRLSEILGNVSHDSINRFLVRENYSPFDLFEEVKDHIDLIGGTLSNDDTVIEKPYSNAIKSEFIGYYWSGKEHRIIKGINLITLSYTDINGTSLPINYRLYNKKDNQTKNDYFREMVKEVLEWGLKPNVVTGDSWYSSQENLKFLKKQKLGFLMGIAKNRQVSITPGSFTSVSNLEIPEDGLLVYLKQFGQVKVFRQIFKNGIERYYIIFLLNPEDIKELTRINFRELHSTHWGIECYHRAIKQLCGIKRFLVRTSEAILTHFFCSIRAFTHLELMRAQQIIASWYEPQRNLYTQVARDFILDNLSQKIRFKTSF